MQPSPCPTDDKSTDAGAGVSKPFFEYLWKAHDYTNNDIRFADTKAVMSIGFCSALISGIFAAKLQRFILTGPSLTNIGLYETLMGTGTALSLLMLGGAILSSVWAFIPRLWDRRLPTWWLRVKHVFWRTPSTTTGFMYWEHVRAHHSPHIFWQQLTQLSQEELAEKVAEHLFVLSCVCTDKYMSLTRSVLLAVPGGVLAAIVLLFAHY
jgi:pycsar effector protein